MGSGGVGRWCPRTGWQSPFDRIFATGDGLHYGYQWWTGTVEWHGRPLAWSAGFGNGGQRLIVVPELDLTVVVTAGAYNQPDIARTVSQLFREIVATVND